MAETMIEEFRGNHSTTLIGVHVRRTDYKDLLGKKNSLKCVKFSELHDRGCYSSGTKALITILVLGKIFL